MILGVTCQPATAQLCAKTYNGQAKNSWVAITVNSAKELASHAYTNQFAHRCLVVLSCAPDFSALLTQLEAQEVDKNALSIFLEGASSFRVRAEKHFAQHQLNTVDMASEVARIVHPQINLNADMKNPDLPFIVIQTPEEVLFGIDIIGFDLAKRPYKIFSHPASVNGVVGFSALQLCAAKKNDVILDPFCDSATIPIEAALWKTSFSPFVFTRDFLGLRLAWTKAAFEDQEMKLKDNKKEVSEQVFAFEPQLRVMLNAKKNIKLSGVQESITLSKVATDWIDAKFEEGSVHIILSKPPQISKRTPSPKQIHKIYDELFYQARYVLAPTGKIALIMHTTQHIQEYAAKHQFKLQNTFELHGGKQVLTLAIFENDRL